MMASQLADEEFCGCNNYFLCLPLGEIADETNGNSIPSDREYYERELQRKIELDKIEAVFMLNNLGDARSAADKKIKTLIIQKIFGTTSKTEIDRMKHTELNFCRQELEELFDELNKNENAEETIQNFRQPNVAA